MIRLSLLAFFITYVSLRSFKDWYASLCVLVVFTAIIEHPDVPKTIAGIQGANPWNILFFFVILGWMANKKKEMLTWGIPKNVKFLFTIYMAFCIIAYVRLSSDIAMLVEWKQMLGSDSPTRVGLFSEHFINTMKWIVPGVLFFHGCNSPKRLKMGIISLLAIGFIIALLTIKAMPAGALLSGDELQRLAIKLLSSNVGFHRVNIAMLMAGYFWAVFSYREVIDKKHYLYLYGVCLLMFYALALTGGRTGYVTWGLLGITFAALKWRRILFLAPIILLIVVSLVPAAKERLMMGFDEESVDQHSAELEKDNLVANSGGVDLYTVTSGRTSAWPFVLEEISAAPYIGHGKEGMIRAGISAYLYETYGELFPHPHNMYLQWLLDNGIVGFLPVIIFYLVILKYSAGLLLDKRNVLFVSIGGITLALVGAMFIAGIGSQTFYPREGAVGMWCAIFLMLRVYRERSRFDGEVKEISDDELFAVREIQSKEQSFRRGRANMFMRYPGR